MAARTCPVCEGPLPETAEIGRPRKYCSDRCRSRAHRVRERETERAEARRSSRCEIEVAGHACERLATFVLVVDGREWRVCVACRPWALDFLVGQGAAATVETRQLAAPEPAPADLLGSRDGSGPRSRILVIEDEGAFRFMLMEMLEAEGYAAEGAADGETGLAAVGRWQPDVVLLDLMLPRMSGFDVLRKLRDVSDVPVIVVTAWAGLTDKVLGLSNGADDYVVKPFHPKELLARIRGVLHRSSRAQPGGLHDDGLLRLDSVNEEVRVTGVTLRLTRPEFRLLELLVRSAGTAQSVKRIVAHVWGEGEVDGAPVAKVAVHVTRLRRKLDMTDLGGEVIVAARGQRYFYRPPTAPAPPRADTSPGGYGHAARVAEALDRRPGTGDAG